MFGKRSEVKDAHDRYANMEISYLLQKMEEYEGIVILATNLRQNLDQAFLRRLHFIVEFPFPRLLTACVSGAASGQPKPRWPRSWTWRPWRNTSSSSGGNIRNIALGAAYLAAAAGEPVGMAHLLHAAEREYKKIGKWTSAAAFDRLQAQIAARFAGEMKG